jgi:peptidoglycan/LPS O-acetylase OafA/YrhL
LRYRTLDSVRGIAALTVVFHHALLSCAGGGENPTEVLRHGIHAPMGWLYATPLRLAVSGPAAVLLFFVLSGFVLTVSLSARPRYFGYAISRVARIWLPFAVAILASSALYLLLAGTAVPGSSLWFQAQWGQPLTAGDVMRHLAMVGTSIYLDSPMWSLVHELRISLLLPLLILLWGRFGRGALVGSAALLLACVFGLGHFDVAGRYATVISTGTYIYFFMVGIALATERARIEEQLKRVPRPALAALWALALAGLAIAPGDTSHVTTLPNGLLLLVNGIAAALLLALCTGSSFLLARVPLFLGRISYSLYLTHVIVILAITHALAGMLPIQVSVAIAVPLSILVADLSQRYIEAPSQRLGKVLARHLNKVGNLRPRRTIEANEPRPLDV